jgi:Kef-type K+ transport system membrane component KefB
MNILIWVKNISVLLLSLFFLAIGVNTLIGSFNLNHPMEFLMYFFSASLLILVCLVGLIYVFFRLFFRKPNEVNE